MLTGRSIAPHLAQSLNHHSALGSDARSDPPSRPERLRFTNLLAVVRLPDLEPEDETTHQLSLEIVMVCIWVPLEVAESHYCERCVLSSLAALPVSIGRKQHLSVYYHLF